jgi:hypothetical protein
MITLVHRGRVYCYRNESIRWQLEGSMDMSAVQLMATLPGTLPV